MKSLDHFKEEFAEEHVCVVREQRRRLSTAIGICLLCFLGCSMDPCFLVYRTQFCELVPLITQQNCLQFVRNINHTKTRHQIYLKCILN